MHCQIKGGFSDPFGPLECLRWVGGREINLLLLPFSNQTRINPQGCPTSGQWRESRPLLVKYSPSSVLWPATQSTVSSGRRMACVCPLTCDNASTMEPSPLIMYNELATRACTPALPAISTTIPRTDPSRWKFSVSHPPTHTGIHAQWLWFSREFRTSLTLKKKTCGDLIINQ